MFIGGVSFVPVRSMEWEPILEQSYPLPSAVISPLVRPPTPRVQDGQ